MTLIGYCVLCFLANKLLKNFHHYLHGTCEFEINKVGFNSHEIKNYVIIYF